MERKISAGSYDLNMFLYGGYESDVITMIAGPAGSGKTNFCILAAVSQAKKGNRVVYMDSEGGFSAERVKQLLGNDKATAEQVLERILLLKPTNFTEQQKDFAKLLAHVKKGKISLILVDGMTMLYRLALTEESEEGIQDAIKIQEVNRALAEQMRALAEIARKQQIPVLVTNQVYHDFVSWDDLKNGKKKDVHFVGGDLMKYWSKCIIELEYERGKRRAILRKHRSLPEKTLDFKIVHEGVKKSGWLS